MSMPDAPGERWACGLLVVLPFLVVGGGAACEAARKTLNDRREAVPCVILDSRVEEDEEGRHHAFAVSYRYRWSGVEYVGSTYAEGYRGDWDIAEADRLARAYPVAAERSCYVDPRSPSEPVLRPVPLPLRISGEVVVALVFGAVALVGALAACVRAPLSWAALPILAVPPVGFVAYFGPTMWRGLAVSNWEATPCVVLSSDLRSTYRGSDPPVYWPDIVYRYRVGGVEYRANAYNGPREGLASRGRGAGRGGGCARGRGGLGGFAGRLGRPGVRARQEGERDGEPVAGQSPSLGSRVRRLIFHALSGMGTGPAPLATACKPRVWTRTTGVDRADRPPRHVAAVRTHAASASGRSTVFGCDIAAFGRSIPAGVIRPTERSKWTKPPLASMTPAAALCSRAPWTFRPIQGPRAGTGSINLRRPVVNRRFPAAIASALRPDPA
jgi:hypothetical protein